MTTTPVLAFPQLTSDGHCTFTASHERGMTLRDYFAAAVLPAVYREASRGVKAIDVAREAYAIADGMLQWRKGGAV